ncbi:hypothetical protein Taro_054046 [Colocasia esculenta]|uniref:Uncharacterized protein n=1 Tax=Colocasia esculenta TaxID=4460 RepID=A0A843XPW8_COLES|nr:hypothetical protein [Colocasia esculenta]
MDLQLCVCRCGVGWSPQLFDFFLVEQQLDLSSVTARLRDSFFANGCGLTRALPLVVVREFVVREFVTRGRGRPDDRRLPLNLASIPPLPSSNPSLPFFSLSILSYSTPFCSHGTQAGPSPWSKVQGYGKAHSGG